MDVLSEYERNALHSVSHGAMKIRMLARSLPDCDAKAKILAVAEGMHNIPTILAAPAEHRLAYADVIAAGVAELDAALAAI